MEQSNDLDQWSFKKEKTISGWKVVEIKDPGKLETHLQYVNSVATELKALNIEKRPASTVQAASTQRLLDMTDEKLVEYRNRPMLKVEDYRVETDAEKVFSEHKADHQTVMATESVRHTHGGNKIGESALSGASEFNKISAGQAFMNTTASLTPLEKHFISEGHVDGIVSPKPKESFWKILWGKMKPKKALNDEWSRISWRDWNDRA